MHSDSIIPYIHTVDWFVEDEQNLILSFDSSRSCVCVQNAIFSIVKSF